MKKVTVVILFLFVLALSFMSCRATKPPCPAYPETQVTHNIELNIAR